MNNNIIDWKKYVNHIFCITYLQNNRLDSIKKVFSNIGIDTNDNSFFSFVYDYEHCIFSEQYNEMKKLSFDFFNRHTFFKGNRLNYNEHEYLYYVALKVYGVLKIAQYFKYDRIIIFEDDIRFLKDIDYIKNNLDLINTLDFDMGMLQTTFLDCWHGIKKFILDNNHDVKEASENILRTTGPLGVYGASFIILTSHGINKIIKYFEHNNVVLTLDIFDSIRHLIKLDTIFALKPLCIQQNMIEEWSNKRCMDENANMIIDEYNNL